MRIGLAGCGAWGRFILRDLRALGCAVTVVDPSSEARKTAADFGADTVRAIAELPAVDGIIVATPTATHAAVLTEALSRSVPVFCEKPLTSDLKAARWLAGSAQGRLFVMDKWRYHSGVLKLAEIARSGKVGSVLGLKTRRLGWATHHFDADAAWILLPHELSIALEVLGEVPAIENAAGEIVDGRIRGLTTIGKGRCWHVSEIGDRSAVTTRRIELHGSERTAVLEDSYSDAIVVCANPVRSKQPAPPTLERIAFQTNMPLLTELSVFVEHLHGGPPPKSSAEEGAAAVAEIAHARRLAGAVDGQ
jgi:predicted dehydrogenase